MQGRTFYLTIRNMDLHLKLLVVSFKGQLIQNVLQIFQNTNEIFSRISALASKERSDQKNKGTLYHYTAPN